MSLTVTFSQYGSLDCLRLEQAQPLRAGPGQVRIAAKAAGVNPIDWKIVRGLVRETHPVDLPAGLGGDVAGVVDEVGEGVTTLQVGDEVLGRSASPAFAQSVLADAESLLPRPPGWSWEAAAAVPGAAGAAWLVVRKLALRPQETVLIHAAAGGVGVFAVQVARAMGARVIGTSSESNSALLMQLGAHPVRYGPALEDQVVVLAPGGVDAVLDLSGRGEIPLSIKLAGGPSRVVTTKAFDQASTGIQVHLDGCGNGADAIRGLFGMVPPDRLRVPIWRSYSLLDVADALQASMDGHLGGKIVLTMPA